MRHSPNDFANDYKISLLKMVFLKCFGPSGWSGLERCFSQWTGAFVFVCAIGVRSRIESIKQLKPEDPPDNVLLEYEDATKLQQQQRVAIFPVLIGKAINNNNIARASPTKKSGSICELFQFQGVFLLSPTQLTLHPKHGNGDSNFANFSWNSMGIEQHC